MMDIIIQITGGIGGVVIGGLLVVAHLAKKNNVKFTVLLAYVIGYGS